MLHREDLREATRKAAEKRRQHREQLSRFKRLKPGEKKHSKRMATVAAVYTVAPFVRSPEEFLQSLMPRSPGAKPRVVRPRPVAKRVGCGSFRRLLSRSFIRVYVRVHSIFTAF